MEEHHIFGGPNRGNSEKWGLKIWLCADHHRLGKRSAHQDAEIADALHRMGQRKFEETHSREEFLRVFMRSYL